MELFFGNNKIYHFLSLASGHSYEGNKHCIRFYIEPIFKSILIQVNTQYEFFELETHRSKTHRITHHNSNLGSYFQYVWT